MAAVSPFSPTDENRDGPGAAPENCSYDAIAPISPRVSHSYDQVVADCCRRDRFPSFIGILLHPRRTSAACICTPVESEFDSGAVQATAKPDHGLLRKLMTQETTSGNRKDGGPQEEMSSAD